MANSMSPFHERFFGLAGMDQQHIHIAGLSQLQSCAGPHGNHINAAVVGIFKNGQ